MNAEIFTPQLVVIALTVFGIVFSIRLGVRALLPAVEKNRIYRELALPIAPLVIGIALGYLMNESSEGWALGLVAGLCSSMIYNRTKSFLKGAQ